MSDEQLANGLRYTVAQVSSYLVAVVERISEMDTIKSDSGRKRIECEELKA